MSSSPCSFQGRRSIRRQDKGGRLRWLSTKAVESARVLWFYRGVIFHVPPSMALKWCTRRISLHRWPNHRNECAQSFDRPQSPDCSVAHSQNGHRPTVLVSTSKAQPARYRCGIETACCRDRSARHRSAPFFWRRSPCIPPSDRLNR